MKLPAFTYHAAPVHKGIIETSEGTCSCCGQARGFAYVGPVRLLSSNGDHPRELCPWCIADGSAAARFGVQFVRARALVSQDLAPGIVEEVTCRTPGYSSWQEP